MPPYKGLFGNATGAVGEQIAEAAQTANAKTDRIIALLERIVEQNDELLQVLKPSEGVEIPKEDFERLRGQLNAALDRQSVPATGRITRHPLPAYTEAQISDR